jgi:hypothetical protein
MTRNRTARSAGEQFQGEDMKPARHGLIGALLLGATTVAAGLPIVATAATQAAKPAADNGYISGVVNGPKGPEAGVWVIAETASLPTGYAKVVVTDDKGRFMIPQLPKASYQVWVRGYGLVDSPKVKAAIGQNLTLKAVVAPNEAAAAEYYPGMYWYSLINIPGKDEFPGTGDKGNGISPNMKTQHQWIDTLKHSCQSCHAIGTKGVRTVPPEFAKLGDGFQAWIRRTQSGQAMTNMAISLGNIGPERALKDFGNWTDRLAAGELPFARPERPKGLERNMVVTMWNFASPQYYVHDGISSYQHNPRVNANGPIYGAPEESTDSVPVLDPVTHRAYTVKHPVINPDTPSSLSLPMQPSPYWGDKPIWDGHSSIHNSMMDADGRVWFSARSRPAPNPAFCKAGSDHPSAKVAPLAESPRQLSVYDPKTKKWAHVDTCFSTHHLYFARDQRTLWLSQGGPNSGVVGWVDTKKFLETGDSAASQGWTPIIVDVNGNGKRDAWVGHEDPIDPNKDKRLMAAFYGVMPSTVDDTVWGQAMDTGFSRLNQPGYLIRLTPGPDPSNTALAEVFLPPEGHYGSRGIDMDLKGLVWVPFASGYVGSFDRNKCKGPMTGPEAATGKHCPEGWTMYQMPGPQFKDVKDPGSANVAYFVWVDRYNSLGLGANVPLFMTNGAESILAVVDGKMVDLRIPYPMGFFSKLADGRIDDPDAGWKGRGLWTMSGTRTVFHNEGGNKNYPKVYKIQVRPDPLAR